MEKIAFISDIHGNLPALKAVFAAGRKQGCSLFFCCGDSVGLGPEPAAVLDFLQEHRVPTVRGNVDWNVARIVARQERYIRKGKFEKYISYGHTWNVLSEENRHYLASLPSSLHLEVAGKVIHLVHALPHDDDGGLTRSLAKRQGAAMLRDFGCDIFAAGHTHRPFVVEKKCGLLLNCGSVGDFGAQSPTATYVVVSWENGEDLRGEVHAVPYDSGSLYGAFTRAGLPPEMARPFCESRVPTWQEREALAQYCKGDKFRAG